MEATKSQQKRDQNQIEYPPGTQTYTLPKNLLLTRGFSKVQANEEILNETRFQIESNLRKNQEHESPSLQITELSDYSFILPDLFKYTNEFRDFLHNDLIEVSVQYSLSESNHLNWWSSNQYENVCRSLYPMVTSGDGNCLLHAASLGMWGLHDRYLILRKALHSTLENIKPNSPLWRRWKWEQMIQNKKYGLVLNDDEWNREWSSLLRLSSYQPRVQQSSFNSNKRSSISLQNTVIKSTSLGNLSKTMSTSSVNIK
jgi:OTU domain-containing protein 7